MTAAQIIELAKDAEFLYKSQVATEQRRLLETVLSNCTFDRGSVCPTYTSPFDLFVRGTKLEIGGESGIRTHGRVSPTHAFQACSFNHSDISPFRINDLRTVWNSVAQNPPLNRSGPRCRLSSAIYERRYD